MGSEGAGTLNLKKNLIGLTLIRLANVFLSIVVKLQRRVLSW